MANKPSNEALGFIEEEDGSLRIDDIVIPPPPVATLSHDIPDKRLIVTELRIKNFKSYANEVVLGPFDKNFTAVVGPNGSGKSNVIDSLLFVFGYRAKKIRSKKVSHLIHKSEQFPNVQSCTVTVRFDEIKETADSYEIIPNTKFMLTRTAHQDDTSVYKMNGKTCTYKEVAKALRRYGIDLEHSRFLILQGEIEAISLMNPKALNENETGMLEYIEDIIGSNRYIQPIQQFNEKLEKLNEEKKEKLHNLKLVEKEKDDLEEPKNKAVEYLRLENQKILSENSLLHCIRYNTEKELENILTQKKDCTDKLNEIKAEINSFKASRKTQEDEMEKVSSELDTHIKNFEKFKDKYKGLERKDVEMHEEIKHLKTKKSKLESTLSSAETDLAKQKKQLETHESETAELTKMREKLESDKNVEDKKLQEVMETVQHETNILQEKKDKLETTLLKMKKEVHNLQSEKDLLQSEMNILTRTDAKEKKTLENVISNYENAEKSAKEEGILLKKEEKQIVELETEYSNLMQQISASQERDRNLAVQLQSTRLKYDEARTALNTHRNRSSVMQALSKEKAQGRFRGVYGRLGDLGAIDEKYDVAISTAAPGLNNILTDNLETAQECVNFLKENKLGYTTFIALDKQTHLMPYVRQNFQAPENVPRLIDLIRVKDEKILPAFYYVMRDTLVAKDLEQATRIGLQGRTRHRVVTLKGELIELSGTMSGGGGKVSRGAMGSTVIECTHTPEELKAMAQEIDTLSNSLTEARRSVLNLQEKVSKITKELSMLKLSVKKRQSNYKAYLDNIEMLKIQVEEQKKKVKNSTVDEKKVAELKSKILEKEKAYNQAAGEASSIEEKVSKLQDEILKVTKGSMSKTQKSVDLLNKKLSEVSQSVTKSTVHAKNCRKNIKKIEEKIKNVQTELNSIDGTKVKLQTERDKCVNEARECLAKQEEAQAAVENLKTKKSELKKALEGFHEKEHQLKLNEINQKNQLKELEGNETEIRGKIRRCITQIGKLKLNEVENDPTDIPELTVEQIEKLNIKRLQSDIELVKVQLEEMKPDLSAIAEYKKKEKLCQEKQKDLDNIVEERNLQNLRYEELRKRRLTEFMNGFVKIAIKLKEIYQMLTLGGDAELEVVDKFDPFSKGIEFSVRPPRKSWKYMRNLSGGEKTLSSLSLVFALHYYRPTPFYVMDEIDAALDVRNVAIVGFFLKERQKNTQFIIVSLRNIMNELADHLIGIYKTGNTSKNVSLMGAAKWKEEDEALNTSQSKKRKSK